MKLLHCITSHLTRQRLPAHAVSYTLLDMATGDRDLMKRIVTLSVNGKQRIKYKRLDGLENLVGGESVPKLLEYVDSVSTAPITVVSDSDVFLLKDGWDEYLRDLYARADGFSVAAINPRSDRAAFHNVPEWNWMSWRTAAWKGQIQQHLYNDYARLHLHDWGHWFAEYAARSKLGPIHLFQRVGEPFKGKSPVAAGVSFENPWAVHCFYGSRLANEGTLLDGGVSQWIISKSQEQILFHAADYPELQLRLST